MAILTGERWQIIVVLIYISLITDVIGHLFMYLLAIYSLCKNVYSGPLPIFKSILNWIICFFFFYFFAIDLYALFMCFGY